VQTVSQKAVNVPLGLLSADTRVEGVNNMPRSTENRFKQLPMIDYVNKQCHKNEANAEVLRKLTQLNNKMNLILEQVLEHRKYCE
jgi:transcription termination factor Rho